MHQLQSVVVFQGENVSNQPDQFAVNEALKKRIPRSDVCGDGWSGGRPPVDPHLHTDTAEAHGHSTSGEPQGRFQTFLNFTSALTNCRP